MKPILAFALAGCVLVWCAVVNGGAGEKPASLPGTGYPGCVKTKIDNAGWIQFMPPHGAMWDYHPPKHRNLPHEQLAPGSKDAGAYDKRGSAPHTRFGTDRLASRHASTR